jgi:hypothetical protein
MSTDAITKRADELLAIIDAAGENAAQISEAFSGTLNLLGIVHGPGNIQERQLIQAMGAADKANGTRSYNLHRFVAPAVQGALKSLRADVSAGLTSNIAMQASGLELGDFLALAKQALDGHKDGEKNVAAVLVAAAFEDTLRRLAEVKAGVTDGPKLEQVIGKLKAAGTLAGAAISTATSGLKFRNDSLHADWDNIDKVTIGTYLAFVEGLLLKHFS